MGDLRQRHSTSPATGTSERAEPATQITLPGDLSEPLKYLDDAQLERLHHAVRAELKRRRQVNPGTTTSPAPARQSPTSGQPGQQRRGKGPNVGQVPEAKANIIVASFKAGVTPAVIARTFQISRATVDWVLSEFEKPRR